MYLHAFVLQMSNDRRRKAREIELKIGGRNKTVQAITEHTTCADIVKMVLRKTDTGKENAYAYAIFETCNKSERMLSEKTKLLKTMRSWGTDGSYHFSLKAARAAGKIFKAKLDKVRKTEKQCNTVNDIGKIENAAKLAHFVQSQKTRLQKCQPKSHVTELYCNDANSSIDEFIANVDHTKMAGFLNFCGTVTANEIVRLSGHSSRSEEDQAAGFVSGKQISRIDKINDVKYATKKVLKPKRVPVVSSDDNTRLPKKHTFVDSNIRYGPQHSTPTRDETKPNLKRHEELAYDISSKIARLSQKEGKDVILQKYFADYISYNSPHRRPFPMPKRERGDGAETSFAKGNPDKGDGSFTTGTLVQKGRSRDRRHSDSDSGQEDHDQEEHFDNAFICKSAYKDNKNNSKYARVKSLSGRLVNYDITCSQTSRLVDYSLNDSSILDSDESVDVAERNVFDEDEEMASFMDSMLHEEYSDEGLSSLGSEDENEILV